MPGPRSRRTSASRGCCKKGAPPKEDSATVLGRIHFTTLLEDLADVDFLVENVPEKWEIKSRIYPRIDAICPEHAVFAVNTSCYSITRVGALTKRPDRVIGMHFMNPVPMKPMVEVIRGHHTSEATIAIGRQFLQQIGKDCILVNDSPGFVSNRVLMLTINEAIYVVQDGVATASRSTSCSRPASATRWARSRPPT